MKVTIHAREEKKRALKCMKSVHFVEEKDGF